MAETLIHEFQHVKLGGLMDMVPLVKPSGKRGYAPWREDSRPVGGLLQGVYAFSGVVRYWSVQRQLATGPDDILHANVLYKRWRIAVEFVTREVLGSDVLIPDGIQFATMLSDRAQHQGSGPVPAEAAEIAWEVALDNWLTWQLRHEHADAAVVAALAAAGAASRLAAKRCRGPWSRTTLGRSIPSSGAACSLCGTPRPRATVIYARRTYPSSATPTLSWSAVTQPRPLQRTARCSPRSRTRPPGSDWRSPPIGYSLWRGGPHSPIACRCCSKCIGARQARGSTPIRWNCGLVRMTSARRPPATAPVAVSLP